MEITWPIIQYSCQKIRWNGGSDGKHERMSHDQEEEGESVNVQWERREKERKKRKR